MLTNHSADLVRVMGMALMNVIPVVATIFGAAYAVQPGYGVQMDKTIYLWIPVVGNIVAVIVIPFVGALSDRIGRRPADHRRRIGSRAARVRLSARDQHQERPARLSPVDPDVGRRLPGLQRGLSEFLSGAVPNPRPRIRHGDRPEHRHDVDRVLAGLVRTVAPPGSTNVPMTSARSPLASPSSRRSRR